MDDDDDDDNDDDDTAKAENEITNRMRQSGLQGLMGGWTQFL